MKLIYSIRELGDVVFEVDPMRQPPKCQAVNCRRHRTNRMTGIGVGPAIMHLCDRHVDLLR